MGQAEEMEEIEEPGGEGDEENWNRVERERGRKIEEKQKGKTKIRWKEKIQEKREDESNND